MTERRATLRWTLTAFVAIAAVLLAVFAARRAREAAHGEDAAPRFEDVDLSALPPLPSPLGERGFWIGGWVGPPADDLDPSTWRTHAAAGLDVSMGPLEDRFVRAANLARLALLDSSRAAGDDVPFVLVRDDSLHPDETTRPGWEERVAAIVRAYGGSRSLAGYFLADEPRPGAASAWAPLARRLRQLDPAHPAYVNFLPIGVDDAADPAAAARWRSELTAAITAGDLALFTFDAYPFGPGAERPHFLATLREAARVSHATARPFGAVLQWTGHGDLRAATAAEARYQAGQALAHGASGITWFTYWTPNPAEEPWRWHGGAIAYDGAKTARWDTLAAINARIRALAAARGPQAMLTAHYGGELPEGFEPGPPPNIPWIQSVTGGPVTVGSTAETGHGREGREARYVLVNRDRARARTFQLRFAPGRFVVEPFGEAPVTGSPVLVTVDLDPGEATVLRAREIPDRDE